MKRTSKKKSANGAAPNKSDFVRSMGGRPAKEIVALAAKRGMKLTERYIYVIRSADKAKARHRDLPDVSLTLTTGEKNKLRWAAPVEPEQLFRRAVAELGLTRSRQLLDQIERSLRA